MGIRTILAKYAVLASDEAVAQDWLLENGFDDLVANIRDVNSTRMPGYNEAIQAVRGSRFGFVADYLQEVSVSKLVGTVNRWISKAVLPKSSDVMGPFKSEYRDAKLTYVIFDVWGEAITTQLDVSHITSLGAQHINYTIMLRRGDLHHQNFAIGLNMSREMSQAIEKYVRSNPSQGFRLMRGDPNNPDITTSEGREEARWATEAVMWIFQGRGIHFHT